MHPGKKIKAFPTLLQKHFKNFANYKPELKVQKCFLIRCSNTNIHSK